MKEFTEKMKAEIRPYLPEDMKDVIIDDTEVVKMNDQKLHGLAFKMPGIDAAPTLYIDEMYEACRSGVASIEELASEMADMYLASRDAVAPPEVDLSYDNVKDKLTVRLLEKKRNHEFLSTMPYMSVGHGLAVIADINMGEDRGGDWRIAINNGVLESLGVDKERLFSDAMSNAREYAPASLVDMSSALFSPEKVNLLEREEPIAPEDIGGMYVLTNSTGSLGAAALFYPDVKEKAAVLLGGDYYILPSSVHEVILVPAAAGINEKELCDMVKQANRTVVEAHDVLSDNVLLFSNGELNTVRKTEAAKAVDVA